MCGPVMGRDYTTYNPDGTQREEPERYIDLSTGGFGGGAARRAENPEALKRYNEIKDDPQLMAEQQKINMRIAASHRLEDKYGQQVHGRPTFRHQEEESEVGQDEAVGGKPGRHDDSQRKKALEVKKGKKRQKRFTSLDAESIPTTPTTGITTP